LDNARVSNLIRLAPHRADLSGNGSVAIGRAQGDEAARDGNLHPPPSSQIEQTRYLSVVAIVKNEGVICANGSSFNASWGRITSIDNGSTDNTDEVLAPFVAEGSVTAISWMTFDYDLFAQRRAYAHALSNFGPDFRWMAFIDLDEFLFPIAAPSSSTPYLTTKTTLLSACHGSCSDIVDMKRLRPVSSSRTIPPARPIRQSRDASLC